MAQWSPSLSQLLSSNYQHGTVELLTPTVTKFYSDQHGTVELSLPQLLGSSDQHGTVELLTPTVNKFYSDQHGTVELSLPQLLSSWILTFRQPLRVTSAQTIHSVFFYTSSKYKINTQGS